MLQQVVVEQIGLVGQTRQQTFEFFDRARVACHLDQPRRLRVRSFKCFTRGRFDVVATPGRQADVDRARCDVIVVRRCGDGISSLQLSEIGAENSGRWVVAEHSARTIRVLPDALDKEADCPQILGDATEFVGLGSHRCVGEPRDRCLDVAQCRDRLVVTEQRQHAAHLIEHRRRTRQVGALQRIAEETVKPLFNVAQRSLRFSDHGTHRQAILGTPRQLGHPRASLRQRLAVACLAETIDHLQRAPFVFGFNLRQLFNAKIDKQQRRGDLQPHAFAHVRCELGKLVGYAGDRFNRRHQRPRVQLVRCLTRKRNFVLELRSIRRAGNDLAPELLRLYQRFLQRAQCVGVERGKTRALEVRRDQRIEPVQALDLDDPRQRTLGTPHVVQRVDHQTLGHCAATFDHATQLQIQTGQHALKVNIDRYRASFECFK